MMCRHKFSEMLIRLVLGQVLFLLIFCLPGFSEVKKTVTIQPTDLEYQGAFRLPNDGGGDEGWNYSGGAMTWYPNGDSAGADDGFPGSLFATGFNVTNLVSEISIPVPVVSSSKNLEELNTAGTLQGFTDVKGNLFKDQSGADILDTPPIYVGIAYLPVQGMQTTGKLYFSWGQHFQDFFVSHMWCETNLSNPQAAGPWKFGSYSNYTTNDFLFQIPKAWADANVSGRVLASGRHREGLWSGRGPALYACAPWTEGNPPAADAMLTNITQLLLYGRQEPGTAEIVSDETTAMNGYSEADYWTGAEWLTDGNRDAVVFIGTKALGNAWYGFANGVVWPHDCAEPDTPPCPDVPDYPNDDRGYWADDYQAQMIFFNPDDLADVAKGTKNTWEPQPYATLNLNPFLFDTNIDPSRYRRHLTGAMAFDQENGLLYAFELLADGDKSLVHVWKLKKSSGDTSSGDDQGNGDTVDGNSDQGSSDDSGTNDSPSDTNGDSSDSQTSGDSDTQTEEPTADDGTSTQSDSGGGGGGGCFISTVGLFVR